jgi:hypothetical protein
MYYHTSNSSKDCTNHESYPFSLKPSAESNWYEEFSSRQMTDERMTNSSSFPSSCRQLEIRDAQVSHRGRFRSDTNEDTRDGVEQSYHQTFTERYYHRNKPPKFDISDVCCYLHGIDQQLISPPRLTRSSIADHSSHISRKKTSGMSKEYPVQTRHTRSKDIKYEICRPIVPIYDHSYVGQPKFSIHRLRLPTQFLSILDQSKILS